jgi:hypothetical protein
MEKATLDESIAFLNSLAETPLSVGRPPGSASSDGPQYYLTPSQRDNNADRAFIPFTPRLPPTPLHHSGLTDHNVAQYVRAQTRAIELLLEEKDEIAVSEQRCRLQAQHLDLYNRQLLAQLERAKRAAEQHREASAIAWQQVYLAHQDAAAQRSRAESLAMQAEDHNVLFIAAESLPEELIAPHATDIEGPFVVMAEQAAGSPSGTAAAAAAAADTGAAADAGVAASGQSRPQHGRHTDHGVGEPEEDESASRRLRRQVRTLTMENASLAGTVSQLLAEVARERRCRSTNVLRQMAAAGGKVAVTCEVRACVFEDLAIWHVRT